MPSSDDLLDLFRKSGALLDGHFRLTSGLHSTGYLQCALVLQHPPHAEALGRAIGDTRRRPEGDRGAVARSRRHRHRPRGRPGAWRAGGVRRAAGRRADAAARVHAQPRPIACSSSRTSSRPAARRARRCRWRRRRAGGWSAPLRSSIAAAAASLRRAVPIARLDHACRPTSRSAVRLCAQGLPVVKPGSRPVA